MNPEPSTETTQDDSQADIRKVQNFWNNNVLFSGESMHEPGSKQWFEEHEATIHTDCLPGGVDPIYTLGLDVASRILDVGCGPGFWVRYFLRSGYANVSACDLTPTAVDMTRKSLDLFGLATQGEITQGNAEDLPFADASFDHVNCQGVIHHTPNTLKCIEEFSRVVKPGGTVCFSVYYKNFLLRNKALLTLATGMMKKFVYLKGRGREQMLTNDPEELVRRYDGQDNPIGKAYTYKELKGMVAPWFTVEKRARQFFPARAFPFPFPKPMHVFLHRRQGLMIVLSLRNKA